MQIKQTLFTLGMFLGCFWLQSCNSETKSDGTSNNISEVRNLEGQALIDRGSYMVTIGGCNDCHTPKLMGPKGPYDDTSRLLSGYPGKNTLPPFDASALQPGGYVLGTPDLTAWVGPWGVSFAANITPDSTTGIGAWDGDTFIRALRTGKHLGQADGREILPPMPWFNFAKATDEDLSAIYAYLRSIPPINNKVPNPLPPNEAMAMTKK